MYNEKNKKSKYKNINKILLLLIRGNFFYSYLLLY